MHCQNGGELGGRGACKGLPGFLVLGAPFKLFQIGVVNGVEHIKGGVPKNGDIQSRSGIKLERLLVGWAVIWALELRNRPK